MQASYDQLLERISRASGLAREEIERKIEAKRAKLSGLVSKEGAAQIVAAELGINFEKQKSKINELEGAKRVNITGKIIKLFPVREYKKENREGKIGSMIVADETASVRVVLWDANHIKLIENGELKEGDVIEINNGNIRNSEVQLSGFADIKISSEKLENVKTERSFSEKKLADIKPGDAVRLRAFVVQAFEPRFFDVCPECSGRAVADAEGSVCEKHGRVVPQKRALLNVVLDDGTENMRAVLFSEQIDSVGFSVQENFVLEREKILGREMAFSGTVRQNKFFNNQELFISSVEDLNLDNLISELEKANSIQQ
ncbi:MAG: DUF2240 family protein [Nanoarchaeota archaeon]|nr:DUF2240 family protein [Nanoarchaeota archaeon]